MAPRRRGNGRRDEGHRSHVEAAIKIGATREQIVETILQLMFRAGGPAVRKSLVLLKDTLA
ncbi:MAG: carboxymuconolactone decarboxylase family protein [Deltaproteobacteria bacterium]